MPRWEPDAAERLERSALELFSTQGYSRTTVPAIAAKAGLTTRTFFRHFVDKQEVLFFHEREFPAVVARTLGDDPTAEVGALVDHSFEVIAERFAPWRDQLRTRRAVVASDAGLRGRELLKQAHLAEVIGRALAGHGVEPEGADVIGRCLAMTLDLGLERWLDGDEAPFADILRSTWELLRSTLGPLHAAAPAAPC